MEEFNYIEKEILVKNLFNPDSYYEHYPFHYQGNNTKYFLLKEDNTYQMIIESSYGKEYISIPAVGNNLQKFINENVKYNFINEKVKLDETYDFLIKNTVKSIKNLMLQKLNILEKEYNIELSKIGLKVGDVISGDVKVLPLSNDYNWYGKLQKAIENLNDEYLEDLLDYSSEFLYDLDNTQIRDQFFGENKNSNMVVFDVNKKLIYRF